MPLAVSYSTNSSKKDDEPQKKRQSEPLTGFLWVVLKWPSARKHCNADFLVGLTWQLLQLQAGVWGYKLTRLESDHDDARGTKCQIENKTKAVLESYEERGTYLFVYTAGSKKRWGSSASSSCWPLDATSLRRERWESSILTHHWDLLSTFLNI